MFSFSFPPIVWHLFDPIWDKYAYKPNFNFPEMARTNFSPVFENSMSALNWKKQHSRFQHF